MSTKKLTLRTEAATRSSDQIMVLSAKQINDAIFPNAVILANDKYIIFKDTDGNSNAYITRDANNNIIIANLKNSAWVTFTVTLASGNQRTLQIREYGTTNTVQIYNDYELSIHTANDNIQLVPADDLVIAPGAGNVIILGMPTSDPHVVGALWNSSGTVKISAG